MKEKNILTDKVMNFAIRIVKLYKYLTEEKKEFIISKQIFRSGTSIGANVAEAIRGESDLDFIHKLKISRKEAQETLFWLELLNKGNYLEDHLTTSLISDCEEIIKIETSTIKTMESKKQK